MSKTHDDSREQLPKMEERDTHGDICEFANDSDSNSDSDDGYKSRRPHRQEDAVSVADNFILAHRRPTVVDTPVGGSASAAELPYSVVIPQRRPGNKRRGFVKAYAPILGQYDIDQESFLEFIRALNKALQENKWLFAVQLVAAGASFVPNHIAMGVTAAVQLVASAIAFAETRWKTNSFLDRMNNEFFRPRGLFCLLMSYNPVPIGESGAPSDADVVSGALPSPSKSEQSFLERAKNNFRNPIVATAEGEASLPTQVAPLVYSAKSARGKSQSSEESTQERKPGDRLNKYLDDRAQARYAKESQGDILSNPDPPQFKNRYLDPTSSASNGGLLGLVSGGYLTPNPEKMKQRYQTAFDAQKRAIEEQQSGTMEMLHQQVQMMDLPLEQQQQYMKQYQDMYDLQLQQVQRQSDVLIKGQQQRRIIRNVLYLMIVNMPSDTSLAAARQQVGDSGELQLPNNLKCTPVEI